MDRFVPVSSQTLLLVWMKGPPRCLAREKAVSGMCIRKLGEFSRNHSVAEAALDTFIGANYRYQNFVRNNQCHYESSFVEISDCPQIIPFLH